MKKFRINRFYLAFAVLIISIASCLFRENPYINVFVIIVAMYIYIMLTGYAIENPTEGEKKVIDKLSQLF